MATSQTVASDGKNDIHARITPILLRHLRRYDFEATHLSFGAVLDAACGSVYGIDIYPFIKTATR